MLEGKILRGRCSPRVQEYTLENGDLKYGIWVRRGRGTMIEIKMLGKILRERFKASCGTRD